MTKPAPRYVLLKFVPDRIRFEPINIGVVVENGDEVITRMAPQSILASDSLTRMLTSSLFVHSWRASTLEN